MRLMRVVMLPVLAVLLAVGLFLLQAGVGAQMTIMRPEYLLAGLRTAGVYNVLYGGAANFVVAETTGMSENDQMAAARALQEVINQRALEELAAATVTQVRPFLTGQAEAVVAEMGEFKNLLIYELTRAGGSPEAVERLREGLIDVPDSLRLVGHVLPVPRSWDVAVLFRVGVGAVTAVALASLIGIFALAGGAAGAVWAGGAAAGAAAAALLALGRLQRLVLERPELASNLERLPLNAAIRAELLAALAGVAGQVAGQCRLVLLAGLLAGLLLVAIGAWQASGRRARRSWEIGRHNR